MKEDRFQLASLLMVAATVASGCAGPQMRTPVQPILMGEYGQARSAVISEMRSKKKADRAAVLDAVRIGVLTLDDGLPEAAMFTLSDAYDTLRAQGINKDRTVAAVVLNEDVKIYKGEPFEQAIALAYYAMAHASQGSWDNARAASLASLFYLQDFEKGGAKGGDGSGSAMRAANDVADRSARFEALVNQGMDRDEAARRVDADEDIADASGEDKGYVAVESDFTLGYLLAGVANQQMGRDDEASDYFRRVQTLDPRLTQLTQTLRDGRYNTLLIVSFGLGPRKAPANEDQTATTFVPRFPSGDEALGVSVAGFGARRYPVVLDVNAMSRDARWRGWEGFRQTKSALGSTMVLGGLATAALARDGDAKLVGLGVAAAGLFVKAGSHADMRFVDVYPQRFYAVPLNITDRTSVTLQVDGHPVSRLVLHDLAPPQVLPGEAAVQLRYVRLVTGTSPGMAPPPWAVRERVVYANPHAVPDPSPTLPYILGGTDARPPTERVLDDYQSRGHLTGWTLNDLTNLYRDEAIFWEVQETEGLAPLHVLEGGPSLIAPLPGTTGYARLFSGEHPPYQPDTERVAKLQRELKSDPKPAAIRFDSQPAGVVSRPMSFEGTGR